MRTNLKVCGAAMAVALSVAIGTLIWTSDPPLSEVSADAIAPIGDAAVGGGESGEKAIEAAASGDGSSKQRVEVAESSTPKALVDLKPIKLTQIPPIAAQQQAFIEGCCRMHADSVAKTLPKKFETLIRELSPAQAQKLTEQNRSVIWDLAKADIGYQVAMYEQLEAYVASGKEIPGEDPASKKNYIAQGSLTWGGKPGPVWGSDGAIIRIHFAFTREDNPIMDRARTEVERAAARFRAEFPE